MQTDFRPHSPHVGYTATIEITGTSDELSTLYDLVLQIEASNADEQRIKDKVLDELHDAHGWITNMEDIARRTKEKPCTHLNEEEEKRLIELLK